MKRLVQIAAALVLLVLAAVVAVPFLVDANRFRPLLEARLGEALGRAVTIGGLSLSLLEGSVAVRGLAIAEDPRFGTEPFLRADAVRVAVEWRPMILERRLSVTGITIERPQVRLALSESGGWNVASLGRRAGAGGEEAAHAEGPGSGMELAVRSVKIANGRFTVARAGSAAQVFEEIDVELRNVAAGSAMEFSLTARRAAGGSITAEGTAGPLAGGGPGLPPLAARFRVPALDLNGAGIVGRATGVAGVAGIQGEIRTKGEAVELTGNLRADKLKLAARGSAAERPVEITFGVVHDVVRRAGRLNRAEVRVGRAASRLSGTYSLAGAAPAFAFRFGADRVPLTELTAMLPVFGAELPAGSSIEAGTLTLEASVAGTLGRFSAIGPVSIANARLANFDLGAKLRAIQLLAGIPSNPVTVVETLSATVKRTPDGTLIDQIQMVVPNVGELKGAGTISAANELDFRLSTTLRTSGALVRALGQKGDTRVPFLVTGTASNPRFQPDVQAMAGEKVRQLAKDPVKSFNAAKDIFNMFRRPKQDAPEQPQQ